MQLVKKSEFVLKINEITGFSAFPAITVFMFSFCNRQLDTRYTLLQISSNILNKLIIFSNSKSKFTI